MRARRQSFAFTLLEMLVVIAIIGILAAITVPTMNSFKPSVTAAATRQLMDDVTRARQLAISQRTTVYMVFVPPHFQADPAFVSLPPAEKEKARPLFDKPLTSYTFVALRSLGDQPGRPTQRYLSSWRTLPEGSFIPVEKYFDNTQSYWIYTNAPGGGRVPAFQIFGFNRTASVPFPTAEAPPASGKQPYVTLPYIAFDYTGQLVTRRNETIPVARGSVTFPRDPATKELVEGTFTVMESPIGNRTNSYNLVTIEWLTGRAHVERAEVK
jgi:prepilin-type N-terminal cleavage/methylation domain-containing protein